jgi:tRNA A-37 threonylcarbamoyl transferase component Bud32
MLMSGAALTLPISRAAPAPVSDRDGFVHVESHGVRWTMSADLVEELLPAIRAALDGPPDGSVAETIKTGPHRTVYRLALEHGDFYLKHFRIADWKALLQNLLRPSRAELEWRAARGIARLGLPTFEPVARGQRVHGGIVHDSFLVSRGIPEAVPLDQFAVEELVPPARHMLREAACSQSNRRHKLATALGELAARVHHAGIEHADFHAGNILIRVGPDGRPALWLIDLHKVHLGRSPSRSARFRNLAILHQFFAGKSTRTDRLRFYRAYRQQWDATAPAGECGAPHAALSEDSSSERAEIAALEKSLEAAADAGWRRADRAWQRGNRHVRKRDAGAVSCRGLATLDVDWLDQVRDDPERLFREPLTVWHKQTPKHRVAEIELPAAASALCHAGFLKCIEPTRTWRRWLASFRMSPVRRSWELGHSLLRRGIDTPKPILFIERQIPQTERYYLLTEAIPESFGVAEFFQTLWPGMDAAARCDWLRMHLRRLALQLRRLHDAGFDHRDLKFANLLVARDPADPRVWLLDLEGVRIWRPLPARRATQNLARINVSALVAGIGPQTERLRFLKWYLGARFAADWKGWWRRIARLSREKISDNRRRGRNLS